MGKSNPNKVMPPPRKELLEIISKKKKKNIYLIENQTFSHVMNYCPQRISAFALSLTVIFHWNHRQS